MKNKKSIVIIVFLILAFVLLAGAIFIVGDEIEKKGSSYFFEADIVGNIGRISIAGGIVPHHLIAKEIIDDFFNYISSRARTSLKTIILLSPDHFNARNFVGEASFITPELDTEELNGIKVDSSLLGSLTKENKIAFTNNNSLVVFEHGITNLLPYIKEHFLETKILPIVIPSDISKEQIKYLIEAINSCALPQVMVMASVDFSHYLSEKAAEFHDIKSINTLVNFREDDFPNLEVDCWQCLYGARLFAKLRDKEFPKIVAYKNSADFLKTDNLEETTSYFSIIFKEPEENPPETFNGKTFLFVGDIMLDRSVEILIKGNSVFYPFEKIVQFLRGIDLVFGNLEGPVVREPKEFSRESLKFAFSPEVVRGLSFGNFDLLSLANNHTLDMGKNGLEETKELLREENINFVGDALKCAKDFLYQKDNLIFLAFNKTFSSACSDEEIIETIKTVKSLTLEAFLTVSIHWGTEYQLKNSSFQQKLAYKMVDAGADLIIGHHPHVVQNIEIYKNKLIFYSLGNFIFDQYFSQETQEGIAVGLEVYPERFVFRLFPIQSQLSQPFLMEQTEAKEFLEKLASRSSPQLLDMIKNGIIEITL